jgi:hypothetical protein
MVGRVPSGCLTELGILLSFLPGPLKGKHPQIG